MTTFLVVALLLLSLVLLKAADWVVIAVHRLSKNSSSVAFVISALFLALATSLPEFFLGITAGIDNVSDLSVGNVIGANIANIGLVASLATLIAGSVSIHQKFVKKELLLALLFGLFPMVLLFVDGSLGKLDGIVLIGAYLVYAFSFFRERLVSVSAEIKEGKFAYRYFRVLKHLDFKLEKEVFRLLGGVILMLISSNYIVGIATQLAAKFNVPVFLVGLVLLSLGTTLPELASSIRSIKDKEPTIFLGNILGSIIVNSSLIVGIAVVISPMHSAFVPKYFIAATAFVLIYIIFWIFVRGKLAFGKREAVILLAMYFGFIVFEFL